MEARGAPTKIEERFNVPTLTGKNNNTPVCIAEILLNAIIPHLSPQ